MLPAPDHGGTPALVYYLGLGINAIPLGVGQKEPYKSILGGQWKSFQTTRISTTQANAWVQLADPQHGVGLICGKISGGLVCLDADHDAFAAWLLDNRSHPLLVGTWVVETGSAKVHIWVRTHKPPQVHAWYLRQGLRAGEVRGEGSYAAAPPSIHPSGVRYETRQGSPENMLVVDDVDALARSLADAYLLTNPTTVPAQTNDKSYRVLQPNPEQVAEIASRVLAAQFPRKIRDALLKPGCQDVNHAYWQACDSHSEIDYAVICAMVRKGWSADESEWVFAGSLLADNCYANKQRKGSRGYAYWKQTWDSAQAAVTQQVAASRVATGANFRVIDAECLGSYDPRYRLRLETLGQAGGERRMRVTITVDELMQERSFQASCVRQLRTWSPRFNTGQRGRDFQQFTEAVLAMVTDDLSLPREFTTSGSREFMIEEFLKQCAPRVPSEPGMLTGGWVEDGVYFVVGMRLFRHLRSWEHRLTNEQFMECLSRLYEWSEARYRFEQGTEVRVLRLVPKRGPLALAPAFPDGDDDDS